MNETLTPKVAIGSQYVRPYFADRGSDGSYTAKLPPITVDGERLQAAMLRLGSASAPARKRGRFWLLALVGLLLGATAAATMAADIGSIPNSGGGRIVITDKKCPNEMGGAIVYGYNETGHTIFGCWILSGLNVIVKWEGGHVRTYPLDDFESAPTNPALHRKSM